MSSLQNQITECLKFLYIVNSIGLEMLEETLR